MDRRYRVLGSLCCLVIVITLLLFSTPSVRADGNFTFYTDYTEYDNNESIRYFINGTKDTLYTIQLIHRDSSTPLVTAHARTGENSTEVNRSMGLYEIDKFGWMTLKAFNKSTNQSAQVSVKITPSPTWWDEATEEIVDFLWGLLVNLLYIMFALCMVPILIMGVFFIKYREKAKAASGELTLSERAHIEDLWNYDEYANDVCARNPKVPSERARLKYSTAKNLLFALLKAQKRMAVARQIDEKIMEVKARLPKLAQDVFDHLVNEKVVTKQELKDMKGFDKWRLLNPGQKREEI